MRGDGYKSPIHHILGLASAVLILRAYVVSRRRMEKGGGAMDKQKSEKSLTHLMDQPSLAHVLERDGDWPSSSSMKEGLFRGVR